MVISLWVLLVITIKGVTNDYISLSLRVFGRDLQGALRRLTIAKVEAMLLLEKNTETKLEYCSRLRRKASHITNTCGESLDLPMYCIYQISLNRDPNPNPNANPAARRPCRPQQR